MTSSSPGHVSVPESVPGAGIGVVRRLRYWKRIATAYLGPRQSHLTFWHGTPEVNERAVPGELGEYWQRFQAKADYPGHYDASGIPMLDYHGHVGLHYNPIAIAQFGLGNYNRWKSEADPDRAAARRARFYRVADWLVDNLEPNGAGLRVWNHHFDWEYRTPLVAPWASCLSQGQGLSVLARAHAESGEARYSEAAAEAFEPFTRPMEQGGVSHWDDEGRVWFEETLVRPPTHILNGFMWASWGVYDFALATGSREAEALFADAVDTLTACLDRFDTGYWSLYDHAGTPIPNVASRFYHSLHVVQLRIMARLTGRSGFSEWAQRWDGFQRSRPRRWRALAQKSLFKLLYY